MKPIINPWLFYLTDVFCSIKWTLLITFVLGMLVYLILAFVYAFDAEKPPTFFNTKNTMCLVIPIIIALLIPEEKTVYKMLIASYTTSNNIEYVKETGKDLVDYIIEKANELERVQYEKDSK